ncbi:sigma-70 family RNA polymerase sigma factor [Streptomyces sp. NPDC008343]|uniref:sigma-70 family RNA polymerase sigma factor n=1 Tax=Streptomyces sp. NPDC008343 TaxID=3364828 RepID=UPI0036E5AF83
MASFEEFAASHAPRLFQRALRLTHGDWHTAEDLVQTTLLRTSRHWGDLAHPEAYARRILANLVIDRHRVARREVLSCDMDTDLLGAPAAGSHAGEPDSDAVIELEIAMTGLSSRQRKVIVLRHWYGLSEADIAQTLGVATGTVKSLNARAIRSLRRSLSSPRSCVTRLRRHH